MWKVQCVASLFSYEVFIAFDTNCTIFKIKNKDNSKICSLCTYVYIIDIVFFYNSHLHAYLFLKYHSEFIFHNLWICLNKISIL